MKTKKQFTNRILSIFLSIVMILSLVPSFSLTALAAEQTLSYNTCSWNASTKTVSKSSKTATATVVTAGDTAWGKAGDTTYYFVSGDISSTANAQITVNGEVHLILGGSFTTSNSIKVTENSSFHIHEAVGATKSEIKASYIEARGNMLAVHGGTVTATDNSGWPGIRVKAGEAIVYGGTVNSAIEGDGASAIRIYGGIINAENKDADELIGGDTVSTIEIYNATVKATRASNTNSSRAVIGGRNIENIIIYKSNVTAIYSGQNNSDSVAIGRERFEGTMNEISITDSTVQAWGGGLAGIGIGGGVTKITLTNSTVKAQAGDIGEPRGTGIGGGACGEIVINGGSVTTDTGISAGASWKGTGYEAKNVTILSGTVDAREGITVKGGTMVITGGNVLGTISGATPTNSNGTNLYARQITLTGAANNTAVTAIKDLPSYYNLTGMRTIGSEICVWVPSEYAPSVVSLGSAQYGGAISGGAANQTATFSKLHPCVDSTNDGLCDQCTEIMPPEMENGFYLIYDLEDYQYLKKLVEGTLKSGLANRSANAKLMANINIGDTTIGTKAFPYGGVFDGNFKTLTVEREYTDRNGTSPIAPFLYADGATFKRLTMEGRIYVNHYSYDIKTTDIGGFVAITTGNPVTFEQCVNKAYVGANNYRGCPTVNLGGFVGKNYTTLTFNNCASLGMIQTDLYAGGSGFVGDSDTTSPVYVNDSYIYLTMAVAGNNNDANSYFCRNEDYTFLTNTYVRINMQRYNGNQGWINAQNNKNKDGKNDITIVDETQIKNGTVTYKLNKGNADGVWKQTLTGTSPDPYPNFTGQSVVYNLTENKYDNHTHALKYSLKTVNKTNDTVCVICEGCAPEGINVTLSIEETYTYSPSASFSPTATVTNSQFISGVVYKKGSTVLSEPPKNAGTYTASFTLGGYTVSQTYQIIRGTFTEDNTTINLIDTLSYTGEDRTQNITVQYDGVILTKDSDYTVVGNVQKDAGTYTMTIEGRGNYQGTVTKEYQINQTKNSWNEKPAIVGWTYGESASKPSAEAKFGEVEIVYTGTANDGTSWNSKNAPTKAGNYTATFTVVGNDNYTGLQETVDFTIKKAKLKVTADDKTATYGDAVPNYTVDYDGFKNGDDKDDLGGKLMFDCDYAQFSDKGEYPITPKGYNSGNYEIEYDEGKLIVSAKKITVTIQNATSIYGNNIAELEGTTGGIVNSDTNVYKLDTTATSTSDVGKYDITGMTLNDNYEINFVNGNNAYEITQRELTVNVVVADKKYDGLNTATITSAVLENIANGDAVELENGIPTFKEVIVGEDIDIQFTEFTLSGEDDVLKNYYLTQPDGVKANITNNWTPKVDEEYTVSAPNANGWLNKDFVIAAVEGYKVSLTNTADGDWKDSLTYSEETENGSVTFYLKNETDGTISLAKTVTYKLDKTPATGMVEFVEREAWQEFLSKITFGLFYGDEVKVKATAEDKPSDFASGIANIEYIESDKAMTEEQVKAITDWTEYNGEFGVTLEDAKTFVYFVRITDKAGNVTYLSTDGAEYDTTLPVIEGVNNGDTYYTTQKVTVYDKNIKEITLNGDEDTTEITLEGNVDKEYVIVATDKADNKTTVTVTMKPTRDLSQPIDALNNDNVNSGNEQTVDNVKAAVEAVDTTNATEEEKAALKDIVDKTDELKVVIDATKAEIASINEELGNYDVATVNSDDVEALEKLGTAIETLTDANNLTEEERAALTEDTDNVAAMLKTIADTVAENKRISDKVDEYNLATVTSDDKADLEQLLADTEKQLKSTNLTEDETSELNGDKKAVEDLLAKIQETAELSDKLTGDIDGYSDDTVKSTDKDAIEQIIEDIDALLETENLTEDEKKTLEDAKAKAEDLLHTIEDAAAATETDNTEKVKDVTDKTVTPEDKTDLEKAKEDLEKALEVNGGNYTEDEKKAIEEEIKRIDDALEVIGNVEAAEELIDKLPDTIKKDDEAAIKAADDAYNALSDYEKSLVDKEAKKALDDAKAALAELNKPADSTSPNTGDNSNLWLWLMLLLLSGGALLGTTLLGKKEKETE